MVGFHSMSDRYRYTSAVREMPEEDRPRERLVRLGPEALRDAELIAVLLRTGTREMGAVALADHVLKQFGDLRALSRASVEERQQVKGMGRVKAIEIKAALELGTRLARHKNVDRTRISCAQDVVDLLMARFKHLETEHFRALLLSSKHEVLKIVDVSHGGLDGTVAVPADVFRQAVREGAKGVIVCHNHPSGDPEPSRDDIALTRRLSDAALLLGLSLLDHIVFGDERFVSLKERSLM
jgi:DNA repair protein RadC